MIKSRYGNKTVHIQSYKKISRKTDYKFKPSLFYTEFKLLMHFCADYKWPLSLNEIVFFVISDERVNCLGVTKAYYV